MALFKDTERKKDVSNYRKTQSIESLRRVNDYVSKEEKVGSVDANKINDLININSDFMEKLLEKELDEIEELIDRKDGALFNYVTQNKKTEMKLITGINCRPSSAFKEMMITKRRFNKTDGRQFKHFVHSYSKHEKDLTPELAHKITLELLKYEKFKGFEILVTTHTDTDTLHSHIVVNSVNMETGKKWNHSLGELFEMTDLSNELCKEYGLKYSFIDNRKSRFKNKERKSVEETKARKKGQSWKTEAFYAINDCRKTAISKEDFISKLESLGYKVRWEDSRKNITFTLPNGRKLNNDKLYPPENFTKEALLKKFELNRQYQLVNSKISLQKQFNAKEELVLQTIKMLEENPHEGHKDYPRTYIENKQALKELMIEKAKGEGLDWER